jgi:lipoyl(octanoyl) transferase
VDLRVLDTGPGEPAFNMALDEALLLGGGPPVLRLYQWRPHAVSLGYFQDSAPFRTLPAALPIVRRLTGGGAILHGEELTFSVVVDAELLPRDIEDSYSLLHDAVVAALRSVGVPSERLLAGARPAPRGGAAWCFQEPGRGDLVTPAGRKLLGSAQRRVQKPRPRVLHHGSLVLRAPELTPFCGSIADSQDPDAVLPALQRGVIAGIAEALDLRPSSGVLTADEGRLAEALRGRYLDPAFTFRR